MIIESFLIHISIDTNHIKLKWNDTMIEKIDIIKKNK